MSKRDITDIKSKIQNEEKVQLLFNIFHDHLRVDDFLTFCQLLQKHCVVAVQEFGKKMEMELKYSTS